MKEVNNENPNEHWQFVDVIDKTILDLGCGRWESVEYRDSNWPTTPEFWIQKGANKVIGVDSDQNEIDWFMKKHINNICFNFKCMMINSPQDLLNLINEYTPEIIKCDIEGGEIHFVNLNNDIVKQIQQYYIETHSDELYNKCISKLEECDYDIYEKIDLTHTNGICKVLFAKRK